MKNKLVGSEKSVELTCDLLIQFFAILKAASAHGNFFVQQFHFDRSYTKGYKVLTIVKVLNDIKRKNIIHNTKYQHSFNLNLITKPLIQLTVLTERRVTYLQLDATYSRE